MEIMLTIYCCLVPVDPRDDLSGMDVARKVWAIHFMFEPIFQINCSMADLLLVA